MKSLCIVAVIGGFILGFLFCALVLDTASNQQGILEDYEITQYDEFLSYLTATIYNPEIDEHRVFTIRHRTDNPMPDLQPFIGKWLTFYIDSSGKCPDKIDTPNDNVWKEVR